MLKTNCYTWNTVIVDNVNICNEFIQQKAIRNFISSMDIVHNLELHY